MAQFLAVANTLINCLADSDFTVTSKDVIVEVEDLKYLIKSPKVYKKLYNKGYMIDFYNFLKQLNLLFYYCSE